jgi:co-chaperonin GroES (HSP10)
LAGKDIRYIFEAKPEINMKPLGLVVAVKPVKEEEQKTEGGIIIVKGQEPTSAGVVVAVGRSVESVKETDRVIYPSSAGTKITAGGEEILLIHEERLLAIV